MGSWIPFGSLLPFLMRQNFLWEVWRGGTQKQCLGDQGTVTGNTQSTGLYGSMLEPGDEGTLEFSNQGVTSTIFYGAQWSLCCQRSNTGPCTFKACTPKLIAQLSTSIFVYSSVDQKLKNKRQEQDKNINAKCIQMKLLGSLN